MEHFSDQPQQENNNLHINQNVKGYLLETAKWGQFLAIMGYIFVGLMVIIAFVFMLASKYFTGFNTNGSLTLGFGALYLLLAGLYMIPVTYLHRFSTQVKYGIINKDELNVEESFKNLKSLFKFSGISTIVLIGIYLLMFLGGGLMAMMR